MSLLLPMSRAGKKRPLILWLCGGAWFDVDKDVWIPELLPYAAAGYAVASIQYRLSNQAPFPAPLIDVKTAVRFLRANAENFGLDPSRFAVMGESAGGYLAAMLGATAARPEFEGEQWPGHSSAVQAVVDWYGPSDFLAMLDADCPDPYQRYASPENLLLGFCAKDRPAESRAASPASYVGPETPPFLILHGNRDSQVPFAQSELLYAALERAGADATLVEIDGADHGSDEFVQPATNKLILDFLGSHLK
jgi:Esterase/lipase